MQKSVLEDIRKIIKIGLKEDSAPYDITSDLTVDAKSVSKFDVLAKEDLILCGIDAVKIAIEEVASYKKFHDKEGLKKISIKSFYKDGDIVKSGTVIASGSCNTKVLLAAERVALNVMQHLSGVATTTKSFVDALNDNKIAVLDTRKTLPGFRSVQKYAVTIGGGKNHRYSLRDLVLIKDNHIRSAGSISNALFSARGRKVEIECATIKEVEEAVALSPAIIMLDNMSVEQIKQSVKIIDKKSKIEISGGVNLKNISSFKGLSIDFISVGAITHSPKASDISLDIKN